MKNIIFMDAEFPKLDDRNLETLSIGMIKPSGEELYLEILTKTPMCDWVKENVKPYLEGKYIELEDAKQKILEFVGTSKPHLVTYVTTFDLLAMYHMFGIEDLPFHFAAIDLSSLLFEMGIAPSNVGILEAAKKLGIETEGISLHKAIDDVRLVKKIYEKIEELRLIKKL